MRHDAPSRMFAVIAEHKNRAFAWGVNDCCLFAARVRDAMTDSDYEAQISAAYSDEASALALIAQHGGLEGVVTHYLGESSVERATRGDVVLFDGGTGDMLGICVGAHIVAMGESGLRQIPRAEIKKVWK